MLVESRFNFKFLQTKIFNITSECVRAIHPPCDAPTSFEMGVRALMVFSDVSIYRAQSKQRGKLASGFLPCTTSVSRQLLEMRLRIPTKKPNLGDDQNV